MRPGVACAQRAITSLHAVTSTISSHRPTSLPFPGEWQNFPPCNEIPHAIRNRQSLHCAREFT
ncbi:protein of unknown function [Streptomyces murinus]